MNYVDFQSAISDYETSIANWNVAVAKLLNERRKFMEDEYNKKYAGKYLFKEICPDAHHLMYRIDDISVKLNPKGEELVTVHGDKFEYDIIWQYEPNQNSQAFKFSKDGFFDLDSPMLCLDDECYCELDSMEVISLEEASEKLTKLWKNIQWGL